MNMQPIVMCLIITPENWNVLIIDRACMIRRQCFSEAKRSGPFERLRSNRVAENPFHCSLHAVPSRD
jgi:hypothetical protein